MRANLARLLRPRISYAVSLAFLGAVAFPCWWPLGDDSFPLSHYPMFAKPRAARVAIDTVVGVTEDGVVTTLSPELIGGARWINMSARLVRDTVRRGPSASEALCRRVATRVGQAARTDVARVEVVTETVDSIAYNLDGTAPIRRRVHAGCAVAQ